MAKKPERAASALRTAILVLGMHRSGTSALARIVNFLGAALPRHLIPVNRSNPRGYWEPQPLVSLHDQLLAALDSAWDDWRTPSARWKESDAAARFSGPIRMAIDEEYGNAPLFVLKDPRICRTLPYWMSILEKSGIRSAPLIIVRNPLEVVDSLRNRDGFSFEKSMLLWLRHNLDVEYETRHLQRNIVTYDALLEDWKLLAVQSAARLGISWTRQPMDAASDVREFLDIELHNNRASQAELESHTEVPHWVKAAYRALILLCDEPKSAEPKRELDRVRHAFAESSKIFGGVAFSQTQALKEATQNLATADERADSRMNKERAVLTTHVNELERQLGVSQARAGQFERTSNELDAALKKVRAEAKEATTAAEEFRKRAEATDKRMAALTKEVEALRQVSADAATLKELAKRLSDRTEWIEGELKSQQGKAEKTMAELQEVRTKSVSQGAELQSALANTVTLTKELHVHETRAIKAEAEARKHHDALMAARSRTAVLEAEERAAQVEVTELRAELAEAWSMSGSDRPVRALTVVEAAPVPMIGQEADGEATRPPLEAAARVQRIAEDLRYERLHAQQLERRLTTWMGLASAALRKITRLGRRHRARRVPQTARLAAPS